MAVGLFNAKVRVFANKYMIVWLVGWLVDGFKECEYLLGYLMLKSVFLQTII